MKLVLGIAAALLALEIAGAGFAYRRHERRVEPQIQAISYYRTLPRWQPARPRHLPPITRIAPRLRLPSTEAPDRMVYYMPWNPATDIRYYGSSEVSEDRIRADNAAEAEAERRSAETWERMPH